MVKKYKGSDVTLKFVKHGCLHDKLPELHQAAHYLRNGCKGAPKDDYTCHSPAEISKLLEIPVKLVREALDTPLTQSGRMNTRIRAGSPSNRVLSSA